MKRLFVLLLVIFLFICTGCMKPEKGDMGDQGEKGDPGSPGNGISCIELTKSDGLVDTYTVYFTDGTTTTFTVTNGKDGSQGIQGEKGEDGHTPVITIQDEYWYIDGVNTGIKAEGIKGEQGIQGEPGANGYTPYIGDNGNWWINGVDTFVKANGVDGKSVYDIYCEKNPEYDKTEEEWIEDLLSGNLYIKETYQVTFYNDDEIEEVVSVKEGELINEVKEPEKEGYIFLGWFTDHNDKWNFYSDCVYCDLNLYAMYERVSEIEYTEKVSYEKRYAGNITDSFTFTDKQAVYGLESSGFSGTNYNSTYFKASNYVDVSNYRNYILEITIPVYTTLAGARAPYCLCFYDSNKKSIGVGYQLKFGDNSVEVASINIPSNATYVRTVYYMDNYTNYKNYPTEFNCDIWEFERIVTKVPLEYADKEDIPEKTNSMRVLDQSELCDGFALLSDGRFEVNSDYSITSYIDCFNGKSINISMMQINNINNYGLAFYNQNKRLISFINCYYGNYNDSLIKNYDIPSGAYYFKTTYFNSYNILKYGDFICEVVYEENTEIDKFRCYQDEMIYFSQKVNQNINYYNSETYVDNIKDYKNTTGVLALPENYDPNGEAVPLIIYFHGLSHYIYYGTFGSTDNFVKQKEHWLDRGYAVLGCNGARDNNMTAKFRSSAPQFTEAYNKCLKYVLENYNIDEEVYVVGVSAGGPASINYCYQYGNVKGLMLLSPWTDIFVCQWGQGIRDTFVEYLEFNNASTYENSKADKYDPAKHIVTDENGIEYINDLDIPVRGFIGEKEAGSLIDVNFRRYITALNNYNNETSLVVWSGRNHTQVCSGADLEVDNAVIDFFESIK